MLNCRFCGGVDMIKAGIRRSMKHPSQRWECKKCGKRFVENNGFLKKRYSTEIIVSALNSYCHNMSLRAIRHHIKEVYGRKVSHTTISNWVWNYGELLYNAVIQLVPETGDTFHADELFLNTKHEHNRLSYCWNVVDSLTRYNVSMIVSKDRDMVAAMILMRQARRNIEYLPKTIHTDGLVAYQSAISKYFPKKYVYHRANVGMSKTPNQNLIERFNSTQRMFTKNRRGFNYARTAHRSFKLYYVFYNFIRPHLALQEQGFETPSDAARIELGFQPMESRWLRLLDWACNSVKVNLRLRPHVENRGESQRFYQNQ